MNVIVCWGVEAVLAREASLPLIITGDVTVHLKRRMAGEPPPLQLKRSGAVRAQGELLELRVGVMVIEKGMERGSLEKEGSFTIGPTGPGNIQTTYPSGQ